MPILKRAFLLWLCFSFFFMQLLYAQANAVAGVTTTEIETVSSGEVKIPTEKVPPSEKGGGSWLWAILGVALVGGAVAALIPPGDDDDDNDDDCDSGDCSTASFDFSW